MSLGVEMSFKTNRDRIIKATKKETFRCFKVYHEEIVAKEKAVKKKKSEKKTEKVLPGVF